MIKTKIKVHISYNGQVSDSFLNQLNRQVLVKIKNDFKNYIPIKTVVFFISFEKEIVQQNKLMNKSKLMQCSIGYSKFGITFFDVDLQWSSSKKIEDEFTDEDLIEILNYPSKELIISRIESWQNIISPPKIEKIVTKDYRFSIMEYSRFAEKINTTGFFFISFEPFKTALYIEKRMNELNESYFQKKKERLFANFNEEDLYGKKVIYSICFDNSDRENNLQKLHYILDGLNQSELKLISIGLS